MPGSCSGGGGPPWLVPGLCFEKPGGVIENVGVAKLTHPVALAGLGHQGHRGCPHWQGNWEQVGSQIRGGQVVQLFAVEVIISLGF